MAPTVVDQELVVHLFAPLGGPRQAQVYRQARQMWAACRDRLGMSEAIPGLRAPAEPPPAAGELPEGELVAGQETPLADRQSVLRRVHDVLNLSVAMAQPLPEGLTSRPRVRLTMVPPGQRRPGWQDFAQAWSQVTSLEPDALLGEARLFLARVPAGHRAPVEATAELGQSLDPLLPYCADRPEDWWRWGVTTTAGYALWDTRLAADTSAGREIVLVAAADRDAELSAWVWSDGTAVFPPFARYLMHAAKLRYEARLLDTWHRRAPAGDIDELTAELNAVLAPQEELRGKAGLMQSLVGRLRAEEARLANLEGELARLRQTVAISAGNLAAVPGCEASSGAGGIVAADQALARWLAQQVEDDLSYLRIDLSRMGRVRLLAAEALAQLPAGEPPRGSPLPDPGHAAAPAQRADQARWEDPPDVTRRVFVVHGRDGVLTERIEDLLRCVKLEPLEWETLVGASGSTAPYLGQLVARAPHLAQATLVLLSPDDIVELHPDLIQDNDLPHEQARAGQARPNVLFELGLAMMAYPDRTIVVEVGQMRPIADLGGLNVIRFDGSAVAIKKLLERLKQAGCPVEDSGTAWLSPGRFAGLPAYRRGPGMSSE